MEEKVMLILLSCILSAIFSFTLYHVQKAIEENIKFKENYNIRNKILKEFKSNEDLLNIEYKDRTNVAITFKSGGEKNIFHLYKKIRFNRFFYDKYRHKLDETLIKYDLILRLIQFYDTLDEYNHLVYEWNNYISLTKIAPDFINLLDKYKICKLYYDNMIKKYNI